MVKLVKHQIRFLRMWWTLPGRTLYDPQTNQLFRVDSVERGRAICGDFCIYYGDARRQTTHSNPNLQPLSLEYLERCEIVRCVDRTPSLLKDSVGWRVK